MTDSIESLNPCKFILICPLRENNSTCLYEAGGKFCGKYRELSNKESGRAKK